MIVKWRRAKGKDAVINLTLGKLPYAREAKADAGTGSRPRVWTFPGLA
jgi:hypothetical protein